MQAIDQKQINWISQILRPLLLKILQDSWYYDIAGKITAYYAGIPYGPQFVLYLLHLWSTSLLIFLRKAVEDVSGEKCCSFQDITKLQSQYQ